MTVIWLDMGQVCGRDQHRGNRGDTKLIANAASSVLTGHSPLCTNPLFLMDWTHASIIDALWSRLASFEWMWRSWQDPHTRGMLYLPSRIRSLCCATRRGLPWSYTWTEMQRAHWQGSLAERLPWVRLEMRLRRLVWELHAWARLKRIPIAVAGGFATWERAAAQRMLQFSQWQPGDIDLFVSRILKEGELEDIRLIYSRFANADGRSAHSSVRFSNAIGGYYSMKEAAVEGPYVDLNTKLNELDLLSAYPSRPHSHAHSPPRSRDANPILEALRAAPAAPPRPLPIHNVSRFYGRPRVLSLNLIETDAMGAATGGEYARNVIGTFDLLPSAISIDVEDGGKWRFHPLSEEAEQSILDRRLRFTTRLFANEDRLLKTLIRGMKYGGYGFQ